MNEIIRFMSVVAVCLAFFATLIVAIRIGVYYGMRDILKSVDLLIQRVKKNEPDNDE